MNTKINALQKLENPEDAKKDVAENNAFTFAVMVSVAF